MAQTWEASIEKDQNIMKKALSGLESWSHRNKVKCNSINCRAILRGMWLYKVITGWLWASNVMQLWRRQLWSEMYQKRYFQQRERESAREREVLAPLYKSLVWPSLECCVQFAQPCARNMNSNWMRYTEKLQGWLGREMKNMKGGECKTLTSLVYQNKLWVGI